MPAGRPNRVSIAGFIGGFGSVKATDINTEGTWNGLVEGAVGTGKTPGYLRKAPGVRPFFTVPGGVHSVRGLFELDGRAFVAAGPTLAEFDASGSILHSYSIVEDGNPVTMVCNGANGFGGDTVPISVTSLTSVSTLATATTSGSHGYSQNQQIQVTGADPGAYNGTFRVGIIASNQFTYTFGGGASPATGTIVATSAVGGPQLLVLSGGTGIVVDLVTNTLDDITAPAIELPYIMCAYIDGYGIVLKTRSAQFNFSNINNFSIFDALDFAARSEGPDNISALVRSHRELWLLGTQTSEVWQDDGVTPFSPIPGVFIEHGCVAPFSAVNVDNTVIWLSKDVQGTGIVYRANGYTPERISTFSVEYWLSQSQDLSASIAYSLQLEGHLLYVLYVPDLPWTWVYDFSSKVWTVFARWNTTFGIWQPWFGRCACTAFGKHLIGDRSSGTVYDVSFEYEDNQVAM